LHLFTTSAGHSKRVETRHSPMKNILLAFLTPCHSSLMRPES